MSIRTLPPMIKYRPKPLELNIRRLQINITKAKGPWVGQNEMTIRHFHPETFLNCICPLSQLAACECSLKNDDIIK